jgi:paraquat-inducible protein B
VQVTSDIYVDAVRGLGISVGARDAEVEQPFMPQNVRVQLAAAGITGVRFLEVDFFDPERYPPPPLPFEPPWNYLPVAPSTLRSLEQAALEFANRLPALGEQTTATLTEGRAVLADGRVMLDSMRRLSDELRGADGAVNRLVTRLDEVTRTFETAVHESDPAETTRALREASASVRSTAGGLDDNLGDVRDELRVSLVALRDTLDAIRAFVAALDRDPSILVRGRRADGVAPVPAK